MENYDIPVANNSIHPNVDTVYYEANVDIRPMVIGLYELPMVTNVPWLGSKDLSRDH